MTYCVWRNWFAQLVKHPFKIVTILHICFAYTSPPCFVCINKTWYTYLWSFQSQRQQVCLRKQDFAASAKDPMKHLLVKGSKLASGSRILLLLPKTRCNTLWSKAANLPREAGFCCFCQRPDETPFGQRQQTCLGKQDFAASAEDPM